MDARWIILMFLATNAGISTAELALQPEGLVHAYFTKENFIITCSARDKDTTKLRWYNPSGDEITNPSGRIHIEQALTHLELRLVWEEAEHDDAGIYKCTGNDNEEITFELIVYGSINFANVEHEQRGREGENLTVVCNAEGDPKPSISWKFKGMSLPLPPNNGSTDIKHDVLGNKLNIYNLKRDNAGNYSCSAMIVTELASQIKDTSIKVQVEYGPEWKTEEADKSYSGIDHFVNLTCEANAEPAPVFEWRRNEETIQASSSYMIYSQHDKTVLQVFVHNESFFGAYDCIAENPLDSIKRRIILEEGDAPVAPVVDVTSEEPGTLTLNIHPNTVSILEVVGYKVECKLPSENWNSVHAIEFDKGNQYILKNLSYDTEYVVRVAARNMVGYGEFSKEITTKTKNINSVNSNAFSSQPSTVAALLSTSVSLWVLRL